MPKNIFVVGLDNFNYQKLKKIGEANSYQFHALLTMEEVKYRTEASPRELLDKAEGRLNAFPGTIDAIVGYWDFPVTCLVPFLNNKYGLPAPTFNSVLKCEHKFWCRIEQSKVIREYPPFCAFNPFDEQPLDTISLEYPFWIKPVKSFASQLGFRIHNAKEFHDSVAIIREGIGKLAKPFNFFLSQTALPEEVVAVNGHYCLAEQIITGRQCTIEGYVYDGHVNVYGVVDSIRESNRSTFSRYQYPSKFSRDIQDRMTQIAQKFFTQIGYNNAPFNIEFFYDEHHDTLWLLEVNPRISQSHCDLFEKVDGASHHEVMIDLALGRKPNPPKREGDYSFAAKFFMRTHEDALIKGIPKERDIQRVQELFPGTLVNIHVREGMRLSELLNKESYSYELGFMFMGAKNEHELLENHKKALDYLPFELIP
ncbi:MAG: ATP-grasp domain-containing protein [Nitrospirales bacterium]